MRIATLLMLAILVLAACTGAATEEPSSTPEPTLAATNTPEPTTAPTDTPMPVENPPAIELLSGAADSCTNAEAYTNVLGFDANYYQTTTENRVHLRMLDSDGNILSEDDSAGENKDGEEGWGFYPQAYELPENSAITVELTVYLSDAEDAPMTSTSTLTYNCTTGEIIDTSFERMGE